MNMSLPHIMPHITYYGEFFIPPLHVNQVFNILTDTKLTEIYFFLFIFRHIYYSQSAEKLVLRLYFTNLLFSKSYYLNKLMVP